MRIHTGALMVAASQPHHTGSWRRHLLAIVMSAGLLIMAADAAFASTYAGRVYPGVKAGAVDLSGLTREEARQKLQGEIQDYRIDLKVAGKSYWINPADLGAKYDIETTLDQAFLVGRKGIFQVLGLKDVPRQGQLSYAYALDRKLLKEFAEKAVADVGIAPVDARIVIENGEPKIEPDQAGRTVDKKLLASELEKAIAGGREDSLEMAPRTVQADIRAEKVAAAVSQTREMIDTEVTLSYEGRAFRPDREERGNWIGYQKSETAPYTLTAVVDGSKLREYINNVANQIDKAPVNKKITLINGDSRVEREGVEGLAINRESAFSAIAKALTDRKDLTHILTASKVAFKTEYNSLTALEYGKYIEINLTTQRLWVYENHKLVYESPITSGATGAGFATVTGLFSIYYKTTNTRLRGYQYGWDYDVPVKYWMPFHKGYGLHDAVWRSSFGGPDYYWNGSHGCVNLPDATAAWIYGWAGIGTPVWVHH